MDTDKLRDRMVAMANTPRPILGLLRDWSIASDGCAAIAWHGDIGLGGELPEATWMLFGALIDADPSGASVSLGGLRAWLPADDGPCPRCDGSGLVACTCPCGNDHDATCDECAARQVSPGPIGDVVVDRYRLVAALEDLPGEGAVVTTTEDRITVYGDGWRVVLMAMRNVGVDEADRFPLVCS